MTTDPFTDAAPAEAEALVDEIIRWDDTIATDGPCDGTWDSLAEYLAGRGWARAHLAAQEPTDAAREAPDRAEHRIARLEAQTGIRGRAVVMYRERARQAEAERDEWRQTALDERGAALDALEQVKVRDARIKAVQDVLDSPHMDEYGDAVIHEDAIRRALNGYTET